MRVRTDVWESLRVCSILLQPIIPSCIKVSKPLICVDASKALKMLHKEASTFSAIEEDVIDVPSLTCSSDRLFQKLSKQQEKQLLSL